MNQSVFAVESICFPSIYQCSLNFDNIVAYILSYWYIPVTDVVHLTGKAGTIKRKRQLRELVHNLNEGYKEDLFDSTPFKSTSKLKVHSR